MVQHIHEAVNLSAIDFRIRKLRLEWATSFPILEITLLTPLDI